MSAGAGGGDCHSHYRECEWKAQPRDGTSDPAACPPQAAPHVVSSRRRPPRLSGRWREPHPFFLCWGPGLLVWGCALWHLCQWTRPSESGAPWVPQAGKQTQTQRDCWFPRKQLVSREVSGWSPGEGHLQVSLHIQERMSHRPRGAPCGPSAHTCAVLAPRRPPLPTLLVPQPPSMAGVPWWM